MSKIVSRTLDFLELFAERRRPLSLSEISRMLDVPVSSCHDVLQALQERGYVYELAPRAGYYPTLRLLDIAKTIANHDPVVMRADTVLRALRDVTDESVLLAKASGMTATYLLSQEPSHPLRFTVVIGQSVRNLHATSAGKALLSTLDEATLDAFLKTEKLATLTDKTITTKAALKAEIAAGRARGWFSNIEESQPGVVTLSAPFAWNAATYIVTIAGPASRIGPRIESAAAHLLEACQDLEMRPVTA
ncbi:MAG TPA: IclR family transcriptional regulator [Caulobacterales bacterium]|nr:IclR family transcriptional regulator [Caulobacterales bacterium]